MKINRIDRLTILVVVVAIPLNFLVYQWTEITREKNIIAIDDSQQIQDILFSSSKIEVSDPFYSKLISDWSSRDFRFDNDFHYNSRTVNFILENDTHIGKIMNQRDFSSLYDLLRELKLKGQYNEEFNLIKYWASLAHENDWVFTEVDQKELLDYLQNEYLIPAINSFKGYEVDKSSIFARELYRRVSLIDVPPLDQFEPRYNALLSRMYITCAVLKSPTLCLQYHDIILKIIDDDFAITESNDPLDSLIALEKNMVLSDIRNYLKYLHHFKNEKYLDAYSFLEKISQANDILYQMAILQKARTLFWLSRKDNKPNGYMQYFGKILNVKSECSHTTFVNDIEIYLSKIKSR